MRGHLFIATLLFLVLRAGVVRGEEEKGVSRSQMATQKTSEARVPKDWHWRVGLGLETRMLLDLSREAEYSYMNAPLVFVALGREWVQTQAEFSRWISGSSKGKYLINNERQEWKQWLRYVLRPGHRVSGHIGLGYGLYRSRVETKFFDQVVKKTSDLQQTYGAELGGQFTFFRKMFAEVNLRAIKDEESLDHDVVAGAQVKLGYVF